jgi:hypothetical protein
LLGQVAEDTARGDRGQLLVVPDQADAAASLENMVDDGGEVLGSHHPRLVDDDEGARADRRERRDPAVARGGRGAVEELGDGLGGGVDGLAELVCCDGGGCEPDDLPAATTPGLREGGHRGGLAAARRSEGDLDAGPTGGEGADELGLTGVEGQARRGGPPDGEVDEEVGYDVPVDPFPGHEETSLGVEDRGRGVAAASMDRVDGCAVRTAEERRLTKVGHGIHGYGQLLRHHVDDGADGGVQGRQGDAGVPGLAEGLGPDVPHLPGRPGRLEDVDHAPGEFVPGFVPAPKAYVPGTAEQGRDHGRDGLGAEPRPGRQDGIRLGPPLVALLAQAAGFVLVGAGLEVGLLGQGEGLDPRRCPSVVGLERRSELALTARDVTAARGPRLQEPGVDADDLPHGTSSLGGGTFGEPHAEPLGELGFEPGVVVLGGHDLGLEHHPAVEGEPLAALARQGLHLVGDHDVGVQVRIAGAGVAVVERRGDEPGDGDLSDAALADASEGDLPLEQADRRSDRGLVGGLHLAGDVGCGEGPQR